MLAAVALSALLAADTSRAAVGPRRDAQLQDTVATWREPDTWLGADKFKHFAMSYGITVFAFAGARTLFENDASLGLAIAAGSSAGLLKEFYDRRQGRPFSVRDLIWDAAGITVGYVMMRQTTWK